MADNQLKPIQTSYKNYLFRSRLEARWAVFFESLGIRWEYEKEGYELNSGILYLPDFFLPNIHEGLWVEIKHVGRDPIAEEKMKQLVKKTKMNGTVLYGEPMLEYEISCNGWGNQDVPIIYFAPSSEIDSDIDEIGQDMPYLFCLCPWCGKVGFEFDGRGARVCGFRKHYEDEESALNVIKHLGHWRADDKCYTGDHERIYQACIEARRARFEHKMNGR